MQGRLIMFEYGKKCISPLPFEKSKQVVALKIDKDGSVMFEGYKITPQDLFREE